MNRCVTDFIDTVLLEIKYKKVHSTISEELSSHICELAEEYMAEGIEEEEAYSKAVSQMGDPSEIGKRLHKTHKPKTEVSIILLLGALVMYGLYISSIYTSAYWDDRFFYKQMFFVAVGICTLVILYFFDYTRLEKYSIPVYFITCLFLLLANNFGLRSFGKVYLIIFGFWFNPSLLVIPILLICYSGLIRKWCDGDLKNMIKIIFSSALPLFLILLEPSLINAVIIGSGFLTMLTFGICGKNYKGNRRKTLLIIYIGLFGFATFLFLQIIGLNWQTFDKLADKLNPQLEAEGSGYTYALMDKIINSAKFIGICGDPLKVTVQGYPQLPSEKSELILTFVIGSLGWFFGILLIALLVSLILRLFIAASRVRNEYGKYLCVGICCVFSLQVVFNILMCLRVIPVCTVALPFISNGGANYVLNMALIGLLLGVYRRKDIIKS